VIFWIAMTAWVGLLLWALATEHRVVEWIAKPLASATFVVAALVGGALGRPWSAVLFAGLCLAAMGDVLLLSRTKRTFLAGLAAFLLGHVAYAAAFVVAGVDLTWAAGAAIPLAGAAALALRWLSPHVEPRMRAPVLAYVVVITVMVALAAAAAKRSGEWLLLVGAFGFYLSDLSVARDRFVQRAFANRAWGLPLYFYSQLLLATLARSP
jgi:uncharacterized membrane protein YhhN